MHEGPLTYLNAKEWSSAIKAMLRGLLHNTGGAEQDKPLNLRQFVPQAAELARQRQLSHRGPRHDISLMRTALRLGRQVSALESALRRHSHRHSQHHNSMSGILDEPALVGYT